MQDTDHKHESSEDKALRRLQDVEQGKPIDWITLEPNDTDIETVRQRIKQRGYKISN